MKIRFIGFKENKGLKKLKDGISKIKQNEDKNSIENNNNTESENIKEMKDSIISNFRRTSKKAYMLLILMIIVCVFGLNYNLSEYVKVNEEDYVSYNYEEEPTEDNLVDANTDKVQMESQYMEEASSLFTDVPCEKASLPVISSNGTDNAASEVKKEEYKYEYIRPVPGSTSKEYSMESVIYSKTLDMWKVHDGIDILAEIGSDVKSVEKGIVERVYNDNFYGISIIIDHGNGVKSIYRNLDENVLVKEKQRVDKGIVIAKIGTSASGESKDDSHLHFEVIKEGEIVSPEVIGIT